MEMIILVADFMDLVPPVIMDFIVPGIVGGIVITYLIYQMLKRFNVIQ